MESISPPQPHVPLILLRMVSLSTCFLQREQTNLGKFHIVATFPAFGLESNGASRYTCFNVNALLTYRWEQFHDCKPEVARWYTCKTQQR